MKKSLLVAILLLPLAFAKASSGSQIIPVPECFPCEPGTLTVATAARIIPIPECFPCEPGTLTIATAARIIPIPECFPCEPGTLSIYNKTPNLIAPVRALRREA